MNTGVGTDIVATAITVTMAENATRVTKITKNKRNLKTENVVVDAWGRAKLCDMSIAKILADTGGGGAGGDLDGAIATEAQHQGVPFTYTTVGTPLYMAPEQVRGDGHGKAVDLWSLGIFLHEMLTTETPFGGPDDSTMDIYANILEFDVTWEETLTCPVAARRLVGKLLTKDQVHRLGCGSRGMGAVQEHPWFDGLDWAALERGELEPPAAAAGGGGLSDAARRNLTRFPDFAAEDRRGFSAEGVPEYTGDVAMFSDF